MRPESERIALLLRRDGRQSTRAWVERTAGLYKHALEQHNHFASDPRYRPLFEKAVREFEEWLALDRTELGEAASARAAAIEHAGIAGRGDPSQQSSAP